MAANDDSPEVIEIDSGISDDEHDSKVSILVIHHCDEPQPNDLPQSTKLIKYKDSAELFTNLRHAFKKKVVLFNVSYTLPADPLIMDKE